MIATWYPLSHGTNAQTCCCLRPLSHGLRRASSPIGGAKGGCAAGVARLTPCAGRLRRRLNHVVISVRWAGIARPLALPMGELARRSRD